MPLYMKMSENINETIYFDSCKLLWTDNETKSAKTIYK